MARGLREILSRILDEYEDVKQEPMKGHRYVEFRREIESDLEGFDAVQGRPTLDVSASFGRGNWARIPWIAFLDERETTTTQKGVYPVYLFREDMSGVYLTFNQGVTEVRQEHGRGKKFREVFSERKRVLRPIAKPLRDHGFQLDEDIELRTESSLGRDYEVSTVAYKLYEPGHLPPEEELRTDLQAVLHVYEDYLSEKPNLEPFSDDLPETSVSASATFIEGLTEVTQENALFYPRALLLALQAGLACQPFTLLAGPTGTGKTRLGMAVGQLEDFEVRIAEAQGGWLDSASAFGYISPTTQDFVPGPILLKLLDLLDPSIGDDVTPVLLIDEINVSPPHIYLAPLLSSLERAAGQDKTVDLLVAQSGLSEDSRKALQAAEDLHPALRVEESGPFTQLLLDIPPNLRVLGTLNFDASTEDLAPKLLSRSFVVWFEPPSIGDDLDLTARTSYNTDPLRNPTETLAHTFQDLSNRDFPVSARAVRRAEDALATITDEQEHLVDILLSGLVLPHVQTVMEGQDERKFDEQFLESLPDGFFTDRLRRMRQQLLAEGMANLWLVAQ